MKEKISAIGVNLRYLLRRVEGLRVRRFDYGVIAILQKIQLKLDEVSDFLSTIEEREEE